MFKKIFDFFCDRLPIFLIIFLFSFFTFILFSSNFSKASSTDVSISSEDSSSSLVFGMELISSDSDFDLYRESFSDVLYILYSRKSGYAGMGGLTVMLDPLTGLPLTYSNYLDLYQNSKE